MNLRQIEIFVRVAETKSMTKTATQLYISQPAISQTIAELEEELNTKLFERINRRLVLTYAGEILYSYSQKVVDLINEAQNLIYDLNNIKQGRLIVGASTTIGIYLLPKIIRQFNKVYPDIEFSFTIDNTSVIESLVLGAQIDIGIVEGPVFSEDLDVIYFAKDQLELVCSSEHKWAQMKRISVTDFSQESLIFREEGSGTREIIEQVLQKAGITYKPKHILNNTEAIKKAVEANIGVAIVSQFAVKDEIKNGKLVNIDIDSIKFSRELNLVIHKKKYKSQVLQEFIEFLKNYKIE